MANVTKTISAACQSEKLCAHCGAAFNVWSSRYQKRKFCSKSCRLAFKKANQLFQKCKGCGKSFKVCPSHYGKIKFCSKTCRDAFNKKNFVFENCLGCGKSFRIYASWKGRVWYCSPKCKGDHTKDTYQETRLCKECGKDFLAYKSQDTLFCSGKCYWKNKTEIIDKTCVVCGTSFKPYSLKREQKYCSMNCYYKDTGKEKSVEKKCSNCGDIILVQPNRLGRGENHYCSLECKKQFRSEIRTTSICENCGKCFPHVPSVKRKFCSNECMMEHRAKDCLPGPSYDHYSEQIKFAVDVRRNKDDERVIDVKCAYCGKFHVPTCQTMNAAMNGFKFHYYDLKFYCSDECKGECPIFGQSKYPKGFKRSSSREVSPVLRQMCLERDGWECQRCGKTEPPLHCHHIDGAVQNKIISNDIDNVITVCKACHKEIHRQDGCRYHELQCKEKETA